MTRSRLWHELRQATQEEGQICAKEGVSEEKGETSWVCLEGSSSEGLKSYSWYRRPFCMAWTQIPLRKASGEWGLAHRTCAHGQVLLWGIRPALCLDRFETCFLLKLPHPEFRQQTFTAYLQSNFLKSMLNLPRMSITSSTTFPFTFVNILPFWCN